MSKSYDIAIAGAGPAGLAAALYLRRAGHKVTIFERFDEPKPVGSGLMLQPTGLTVLSLSLTPFYQSDSVALPLVRDRLVAIAARIPPGPQFLAAMVAGTVIDPFRRIGLAEFQWPAAG